jgi:hypothetical protein
MMCPGCRRVVPWNPFGACSWECFDRPRDTAEEEAAMHAAAPEAFAFFLGLGPGERVDDGG